MALLFRSLSLLGRDGNPALEGGEPAPLAFEVVGGVEFIWNFSFKKLKAA